MSANYLIISDLQIPFENSKALSFCKYLQKHYRVPKENIYCVGDETDQYFGGLYRRDVNGIYTAKSELEASKSRLFEWYKAFPNVKVCLSNHGSRWIRKATEAEIPSMMLRRYEDIIEAPDGWHWQKQWKVAAKHPFTVLHGDDFAGPMPHLQAAMHLGCSVVMGHHHSLAGTEYIKTAGFSVWGMVTGCLIDPDQYAFDYCRNQRKKPMLSAGIVLDGGLVPLVHCLA